MCKKAIKPAFTLCLILLLAACGGSSDSPEGQSPTDLLGGGSGASSSSSSSSNSSSSSGLSSSSSTSSSSGSSSSSSGGVLVPPDPAASDAVLSLRYESSERNQLALPGMGGDESTRLVFKLVGVSGDPIPDETVSFKVSSDSGNARLVDGTETDISDESGMVSTVLLSGTTSVPVIVTATHNATGVTAVSEQVVISTGMPIQSRFSVSLDTYNPPNAYSTDGVTVQISIIASDQYGHNAKDGTQVMFWSPESGNITASCALAGGRCTATWASSDPRPGDGRVTIIAFTNGVEDFTDTNSDHVFEEAELVWVDLSEPCVDANENSVCDSTAGEFFVDVNDDGVPSGPDGFWNGPCLTSVDPGARCPDRNSTAIFRMRTIVLSTDDASVNWGVDFPPPGATIDLTGGSQTLADFMVQDSNGNAMPAGTTITFTTDNGELVGTATWTVGSNVTEPTGPYEITLKPDDTTSTGTLTLTIQSPGEFATGSFETTWIVND